MLGLRAQIGANGVEAERLNPLMHLLNLKNKVVLVSKRLISKENEEHYEAYFGTVSQCNDNTVIVIKTNGETESLPYGDELYEPAEEGFYELPDGSTHENPDYIAEFAVYETEEIYKQHKK